MKKFKLKSFLLLPIDAICIFCAYLLAGLLRSDDIGAQFTASFSDIVYKVILNPASIAILVIYLLCFVLFDMYRTLLSHITLEDVFLIGGANATAAILSIIYNYTVFPKISGLEGLPMVRIPTGVVLMAACFIFLLTIFVRAIPRTLSGIRAHYYAKNNDYKKNRVIIYGAGDTGLALQRELARPESTRRVVAFYDSDSEKIGSKVNGISIYGGRKNLDEVARTLGAGEIIIAIPSATPDHMKAILEECKTTGCKVSKLPSIQEMVVDTEVKASHIKDIEIEDLLGRAPANIDVDSISGYLKGSTVLVTGGGGSIGSELCRQIMKYDPKKLIILDIYENNAYDLENELRRTLGNDIPVVTRIASVRDYDRMTRVFDEFQPDVVFHAAAHKHVPLMEESPGEAIKNNVFGTYNAARVAEEHGVKTFVLISTDKAVNPTNIMGATKRIAEIIIQAYSKKSQSTRFVAVRFGNVLGSNGSVVPLFKKQIAQMGPVTVTHKDITRFFMTIPEAARLVIQAGAMAKGGEIFILDMGEPVKIDTLARNMITLSGYRPDIDIPVVYTGLRKGEKLYEELLRDEEGVSAAERDGFFVARPFYMEWSEVEVMLSEFSKVVAGNHSQVAGVLKKYVPTFKSDERSDAEN